MDLEQLRIQWRRGDRQKLLFFWGHRAERDGSVGKGCFSQWWPAPFVIDDERYATAEHFMMAAKARLFRDDETRERIMNAKSPGAAKQLGRSVRGFDEAAWVNAREAIVLAANMAKFDQNADLRAFLLRTKKLVLVEASPVDRIWGIGLAHDDPDASNPLAWRGLNLLGFALMSVRDHLSGNEERAP